MHPHRLLRFHLVARIALLLQASGTAALGWWSPTSLTATLIDRGGGPAQVLLLILSAIVVVGWLDVLINDGLPDRFRMLWARRRRHLGYAVLAATYLIQAFASSAAGQQIEGAAVLIVHYVATALVCAWYAWTAALRPHHAL